MGESVSGNSEIPILERHILNLVARALGLPVHQVSACIDLLDSGASIPFIARYRKEATGSVDDAVLFTLSGHLERIRRLEERRSVIITKIAETGFLTPVLTEQVMKAGSLAELEDIYLPYKPRRKTRADKAREQGLGLLADILLIQKDETDVLAEASRFINPELGVHTAQEALNGAEDIIANKISENPQVRSNIRTLFQRSAIIHASPAKGTGGDGGKWSEYIGTTESVNSIPSHRILALFRGEAEGYLSLKIVPDTDEALNMLSLSYVIGNNQASECVADAVTDGYYRLLGPALQREMHKDLKERADEEAARVFASNVRSLLYSPPLGSKNVLALDPGFRTGCKVVVLNTNGNPLDTDTIFPHKPREELEIAGKTIRDLCLKYQIEVIAIGDGTAGRETWQFIKNLNLSNEISIVIVSEQGASVYSASELARKELPGMDVTMRGAVSIGRRLQDPLAELVKIEPRSIGVGQYQHDIKQSLLSAYLEEVIRSVVNEVGVDLNSASSSLLAYVSGLNPRIASSIVQHREKFGPFRSRDELLSVKGIGERVYEQAAGFLRIRDGTNPLDNTGIHPEQYDLVEAMAASIGGSPGDLIGNTNLVRMLSLEEFVSESGGMVTMQDICDELIRPGRDPRGLFEPPIYTDQVSSIENLTIGDFFEGIVTNITKFGVFVNLGIPESGLVHISEMADFFVSDPSDLVAIHERIRVRVIGIDIGKGRISLSMKQVDKSMI